MDDPSIDAIRARGLRRLGPAHHGAPRGTGGPRGRAGGRALRLLASILILAVAAVAVRHRWTARTLDLDRLDVARRVEAFSLRDTDGRAHSLADWRRHRAVVLFVLGTGCPVSNEYATEMTRLFKTYTSRGVAFLGIYPDPDVDAGTAAQHGSDYEIGFPRLLDPCHELVADLGVRVTPEAVVLTPGGEIRYRGRIDDRHSPGGKHRGSPSRHDLEEALESVLAGEAPAVPETEAIGCPLPAPRPIVGGDEAITYTRHVAPILWSRCAGCHRPGEVGPFSLLTYRDAAKRADFLREITAARRMPPWKPVHGFGSFLDEQWLGRRELAVLARWAEDGAPEGDRADLPPPPAFASDWALGEPDLILSPSGPLTIPAGGDDIYRVFILPVPLDRDQAVSAVVFRPGNRRVVHHSRIYLDETGRWLGRDRDDPGPGFATVGESEIQQPTIAQWIPGLIDRPPPEGVGRTIKAGSHALLLIHYHPTGKPEVDRSSIGLYFRKTPPTRIMTSVPLSTAKIDIPPGEGRHRIALKARLPVDVHAYNVLPHGHFLMREIKLAATLPDGTVLRMLWIKDWDFNWQGQYHFAEPVALPRGTELDVVAYYDNSAGNPSNPFNPPRRVRYGLSSTDEMLGCHIQVIADRPDEHRVLKAKWPDSL